MLLLAISGLTVTVMDDGRLVQPVTGLVWVTQYFVTPAAVVEGVGAVEVAPVFGNVEVEPEVESYQVRLLPVVAIAVSCGATSFKQ